MRIVQFTVKQDAQIIGSVAAREQAVNAAKTRAAGTGRPVSVIAHLDDGREREVVYNPDGTVDRIWKKEESKK